MTLTEAATRLSENLFNGRHGIGNVGVGTDRLYVYIFGSWHGDKPSSFMGWPVEWRVKTGIPRALAE